MATSQELPELLWHYTSLQSLISIAQNKGIWASEIHYLNDAMEFQFGLQRLLTAIDRCAAVKSKKGAAELLKKFFERLPDTMQADNLQLFVFSMSTKGDLLSQWRAYCPESGGCNLGFSFNGLRKLAERRSDLILVKCLYNEYAQLDLAEHLVNQWVEIMRRGDDPIGSKVAGDLLVFTAQCKDSSFSEEDEWRLLFFAHPNGDRKVIRHRLGKSFVVPCREWIPQSFPLEEIRIGPCPHPELSMASIGSLLRSHGIKAKLSRSAIPYRSW